MCWCSTCHASGSAYHPGRADASYSTQARAEETRRGRREGLLVGATVTWHPTLLEDTLLWILFPPGMFSQPLPVAYVPLWEFDRHGEPDTFGLASFRSGTPIPATHDGVAHVTDTDVDLHRPTGDQELSFVAGYHAVDGLTDGRYAAWRRAALQVGRILLVTGRRAIPTGPAAEAMGAAVYHAARDALRESHTGVVPATRPPGDTPHRHGRRDSR